jgi:hypothetical protein
VERLLGAPRAYSLNCLEKLSEKGMEQRCKGGLCNIREPK